MSATGLSDEQRKKSLEARANSVKQLCDLYRVVIGIAVGLAFHNIIDTAARPIPVRLEYTTTFLALIVTVIPFFHGAVRHLFATYVEDGGSTRIRNWAILIDYCILFAEGGLFVALGSTLGATDSFLIVLTSVLAVDCMWGLLASVGFAGSQSQKAEIKWAAINFVTVVILVTLALISPFLLTIGLSDARLEGLILVIAVARTGIDYILNHDFYFP